MTIGKAKAALRTFAFLAVISLILGGLSIFAAFPQQFAAAADTTKPSISTTAPSDGATVSGAVQWTVQASDNVGVNSVMFFIDGKTYSVTFSAPYFTNVATAALSNGQHTWLAIAYDAAGNEARSQITVTTNNPDTTGPIVTILNPLTGTTVSGTIDYRARATDVNGATKVEFYVDNTLVGTDTSAEYDSGTNTISQYAVSWNTVSKPNGSHTLLVKAYDKYNNFGTRTITVTVSNSADTTPPPAPIISSPASGTVTNDSTPTFTGTAEASTTVKLYDGSSTTPIATTTASSTGSWSATPSSSMSNAAHSIHSKATDRAGNTSPASASISVTISTSVTTPPPAPVIASPSTGTTTNDSSPTFTGTAAAASIVKLYDGSSTTAIATTTASSTGSWSATSSALSNGVHSITAKATNSGGYTSAASSAVSITIDTVAPLAPIITSPLTGTTTNDSTPTFTGTAEASTTVKLYDGSTLIATTTASGTGSWSATSSILSNGAHSVTAKATDAAGNTSPASAIKSITIDTIAPSTSITSPSQGDIVKKTITVSVTATDNVAISKVELYVDGSLAATDTTSAYSFLLDTSTLTNGSHTLLVKAFDGAGNVGTHTITVKVVG